MNQRNAKVKHFSLITVLVMHFCSVKERRNLWNTSFKTTALLSSQDIVKRDRAFRFSKVIFIKTKNIHFKLGLNMSLLPWSERWDPAKELERFSCSPECDANTWRWTSSRSARPMSGGPSLWVFWCLRRHPTSKSLCSDQRSHLSLI